MPASLYLIKRQGARSSGSVERQAICRVCAAVSRSVPRSMSQSLPRHSADHLTCTSEYEPIVDARAVDARARRQPRIRFMYMLTNHCSRVLFCVLSLTCCSLAVPYTLCAWHGCVPTLPPSSLSVPRSPSSKAQEPRSLSDAGPETTGLAAARPQTWHQLSHRITTPLHQPRAAATSIDSAAAASRASARVSCAHVPSVT